MKICNKCSTENSNDSKFCIGCGNDISNIEESKDLENTQEIKEKTNEIIENFKNLDKNQRMISISALVGVVGFFLSFGKKYDLSIASLFDIGGKSWILFFLIISILFLQYVFLIQKKDTFSFAKSNIFKIIISTFVLSLFIGNYIFNGNLSFGEIYFSQDSEKFIGFYLIFGAFASILYFSFIELFNLFKNLK